MSYTRYSDADGILITNVSGKYTLDEALELQNDMHNYVIDGEIYELFIHSNDLEMHWSSSEALISADTFINTLKTLKKAAIAFVSDNNFVFGICRQLQMRVENELIQMCVFRSEDTAHQWLLELKLSNVEKSTSA